MKSVKALPQNAEHRSVALLQVRNLKMAGSAHAYVRGSTGFNLWSLFVAVVGAIVALLLYHAVTRRNRL